MSNAALSNVYQVKSPPSSLLSVASGLAVWLVVVLSLGAAEVFVAPPEIPPLALLIAVTAPVILFFAAFRLSEAFRAFVLTADLRFITAIQAWRIGGFSFLVLYTYGILPGYFAWPAGVGDMAIGITAPGISLALLRRSGFAASKSFAMWNVFGVLDLVVAVGMGAFGPYFVNDALGAGGTRVMAHLPLVLVPSFFVPAFIILHLAALARARRFAAEKRS